MCTLLNKTDLRRHLHHTEVKFFRCIFRIIFYPVNNCPILLLLDNEKDKKVKFSKKNGHKSVASVRHRTPWPRAKHSKTRQMVKRSNCSGVSQLVALKIMALSFTRRVLTASNIRVAQSVLHCRNYAEATGSSNLAFTFGTPTRVIYLNFCVCFSSIMPWCPWLFKQSAIMYDSFACKITSSF